jgi:hypothetical protein
MVDYTSLIDKLTKHSPSSKRNARTVVNNPYFRDLDDGKWNDRIIENLVYRLREEYPERRNYEVNGDLLLLEKAIEHVNTHFKPLTSQNIIVINHGLFTFITHANVLNKSQKKELSIYKKNLVRLLNSKDLFNADMVIHETLHHYTDSTSLLVEKGIVDSAFLTHYDNGCPLENSHLKIFGAKYTITNEYKQAIKGKTVIFAGAYNGDDNGNGCLAYAIDETIKVIGQKNVYAIVDVVLNVPIKDSRILPKSIWYNDYSGSIYCLPRKQTMTLDKALEKFGK